MVTVTYRWPHRAPQPRLPLQTVERERASPPGPPGTCPVGTCPPLLPGTHLFSFHLGGDHGPVRADDDAGLPLLPLQEQRRWEGTQRDQAPSWDRAGVTWWPGRMGDQECEHPTGCRWPGAVTFSPGAPWGPADPWSPFGPTGPCRKDTEPTSFPTHQRQAPQPPLHHHHSAAKHSRTSHHSCHQGHPAVPRCVTDSPGSQRGLVCPAERIRDAPKSKPPLSKKRGALLALLRGGHRWGEGTYLWTRKSHQGLLQKETK